MLKYTKTRHPELFFSCFGHGEWSFFHKEDDHYSRVGQVYPSKQTLIWDMERYFNFYGWPE